MGDVELDGAGARALADHDVELEVLEHRIERLLHHPVQAVDLVDKKDIAFFQIGEDGSQIAGTLDGRAGGGLDPGVELMGDDMGEGGLTESRRAVKEAMIERLTALAGSIDEYLEVLLDARLPDILGKGLGPHPLLKAYLFFGD
jgi:hypothetical protein